jgi:hypothetical protein
VPDHLLTSHSGQPQQVMRLANRIDNTLAASSVSPVAERVAVAKLTDRTPGTTEIRQSASPARSTWNDLTGLLPPQGLIRSGWQEQGGHTCGGLPPLRHVGTGDFLFVIFLP